MAQGEIHIGDVGTTLRATIKSGADVYDLSGVTITDISFVLKSPLGTVATYTASAFESGGTNGVVDFTVGSSGVFNEAGTWKMQVIVNDGTNVNHSDIEAFLVYKNL
jgi:hypothetical protein